MRIAQVAHLTESVPPKMYGGSERIIAYLTDELVRLGHDVTLFASADSVTTARLEAVCGHAVRNPDTESERMVRLMLLQERVLQLSAQYDIIHAHLDFLAFPLARRSKTPIVTTVHGRLDLPELQTVYREFSEVPLVSVSDAQRQPCRWANWKATIHHGLPRDLYRFNNGSGGYLAFLGRFSTEKGPAAAIEISKRAGLPLRIAAKLDSADVAYYEEVITPLLSDGSIEYVGELTDREKNTFLGDAVALVCPFRPESFGLVLIESLACGTPVLTYNHGSFPEIIEDGVTGFLCKHIDDMVKAVDRLSGIDRARCRRSFEERFASSRMAREYVRVYDDIVA
ncbi:MAG TPA: glycosyltransferase family 4 protein [Nitrospiraceae bacterium]|nr:glycosyltransferase family 4 protein [Nitrospiraceae bacterium]